MSNWGTIDEPFKAYYGSIPASAVGEWYQRYGNRLFAKNIRYYKGSTDVNQETLSGSCVTDGYHDMGIDAVYNDSTQKKLVLVQSKWRRDGTGGISQEEAGSFAQGVKRIINSEFEGCNAKISAKQTDIIAALKDMDYQIEVIFCHTGNQCITDYSKRPITDLLKQVNEEDVAEILVFKEIKLQDIYYVIFV